MQSVQIAEIQNAQNGNVCKFPKCRMHKMKKMQKCSKHKVQCHQFASTFPTVQAQSAQCILNTQHTVHTIVHTLQKRTKCSVQAAAVLPPVWAKFLGQLPSPPLHSIWECTLCEQCCAQCEVLWTVLCKKCSVVQKVCTKCSVASFLGSCRLCTLCPKICDSSSILSPEFHNWLKITSSSLVLPASTEFKLYFHWKFWYISIESSDIFLFPTLPPPIPPLGAAPERNVPR